MGVAHGENVHLQAAELGVKSVHGGGGSSRGHGGGVEIGDEYFRGRDFTLLHRRGMRGYSRRVSHRRSSFEFTSTLDGLTGVVVGVALERWHRRHRQVPETGRIGHTNGDTVQRASSAVSDEFLRPLKRRTHKVACLHLVNIAAMVEDGRLEAFPIADYDCQREPF